MNDPATTDPLASIRGRFPGWEAWVGISGLLYARRRLTSPPVVFRSESAGQLEAQIRAYEEAAR